MQINLHQKVLKKNLKMFLNNKYYDRIINIDGFYGEKFVRKLLLILGVLILTSTGVFAAKIPDDVREYINKTVPGTDIRFDGVIILPDNTLYLPLYP